MLVTFSSFRGSWKSALRILREPSKLWQAFGKLVRNAQKDCLRKARGPGHARLQTWSPRHMLITFLITSYYTSHPIRKSITVCQLVRRASNSMFCLCVLLATVFLHQILRKRDKTTRVLESRWGFEGDFAAQNMMTAFGKGKECQAMVKVQLPQYPRNVWSVWFAFIPSKLFKDSFGIDNFIQLLLQVGHTPEVYSLSLEIDKLLRITSGHRFQRSSFEHNRHSVAPSVSFIAAS